MNNTPNRSPEVNKIQSSSTQASPRELDDDLMNLAEVRLLTGWSPERIYRLTKRGDLRRARRPGHQPYYLRSSVEKLLAWMKSRPSDTPEWSEGYPDRREFGEEYERWLAEAADEPPLTSIASAEASA